jgi:Fic family protein
MTYPVKTSEDLIKSLHYKLMQGIRDDAGEYSKHHRAIRGLDLSLCHPQDIPDEMNRLIKEFNAIKVKTLKDIAKFHVDFELIHPFGDANGRVGRLLMVIQCLSLDLPPVIIHDAKKLIYYDTLYYAQTKHEGAFICFVYDELIGTACILDKYL